MLASFFSTCQAVGQAVRPSRFSILVLGLGVVAFFVADQTPEALITLAQRQDLGAEAAFLVAIVMWGQTSWYLARVLSRFGYPDRQTLPPRAEALETAIFRWLPRALGVAPMVVVFVALLLCLRRTRAVIPLAVAVFVVGVAWGAFLVYRRSLVERLLRRAEQRTGTRPWYLEQLGQFSGPQRTTFFDLPRITQLDLWSHLGFFAVMVVLFAAFPVAIPQWLGAQTILVLAMAGWIVAGSWVTYLASWLRMPIFLLVVGAALLLSPWNDDHVAQPRPSPDDRLAARPALLDDFTAWHRAGGGPGTPFVIVATEGGGIRAAYWTAAMLSALQDTDPTFSSHVYAISSVSGGSVGAAVFDALVAAPPANFRNTAGDILSRDSLAPPLARMFYPDLLQRFVAPAFSWADRGDALVQSWVASVHAADGASDLLGRPLDDTVWVDRKLPRLFFNTTWVETGKRVVLSYPRAAPPCRDTQDGDALASFTVGEAALASARFPYVSPALTVPGNDGAAWGHLVDGGYFENSGAQTAADILRGTEDRADARVIILRYHDGTPPQAGRWGTELTSPPYALSNTRDAHEQLAIEALKAMLPADHVADFVLTPVTNALPLGWMLSAEARTDINFRVDEMLGPGSPGRQALGWWGSAEP